MLSHFIACHRPVAHSIAVENLGLNLIVVSLHRDFSYFFSFSILCNILHRDTLTPNRGHSTPSPSRDIQTPRIELVGSCDLVSVRLPASLPLSSSRCSKTSQPSCPLSVPTNPSRGATLREFQFHRGDGSMISLTLSRRVFSYVNINIKRERGSHAVQNSRR